LSKFDELFQLTGQVPLRDVRALYRQYKVDFDMFGYSAASYIALARREAP
jgi:hypothetical protein